METDSEAKSAPATELIPLRAKLQPFDTWGLASSISLVLGSLGTWASLGPFSVGGTSMTGGKIVLALGLIASGILAVHIWGQVWDKALDPFIAGSAAFVALGLGIHGFSKVMGAGADIFGITISPSVGWGLVLTVIGSASLLAWSALAVRQISQARNATEGESGR